MSEENDGMMENALSPHSLYACCQIDTCHGNDYDDNEK
jgi:hypothetical protein